MTNLSKDQGIVPEGAIFPPRNPFRLNQIEISCQSRIVKLRKNIRWANTIHFSTQKINSIKIWIKRIVCKSSMVLIIRSLEWTLQMLIWKSRTVWLIRVPVVNCKITITLQIALKTVESAALNIKLKVNKSLRIRLDRNKLQVEFKKLILLLTMKSENKCYLKINMLRRKKKPV